MELGKWMKDMSPHERFLLLRLCLVKQFFQLKEVPSLDFKTTLGTSQAETYRLLKTLNENRFIRRKKARRVNGSMGVQYSITLKYRFFFRFINRHSHHDALIKKLLLWRRDVSAGSQVGLNIPTKMVLITILHHANKVGIANLLGHSQIADLSGVGKSRIKRHLDILLRLHFLRSSVSGFNHPRLFGKAKSCHCVNLDHLFFQTTKADGRSLVLFGSPQLTETNEETDADQIMRFVRRIKAHKQYLESSDAAVIVPLFQSTSNHTALKEMIQWWLHYFASKFLTDRWADIPSSFDRTRWPNHSEVKSARHFSEDWMEEMVQVFFPEGLDTQDTRATEYFLFEMAGRASLIAQRAKSILLRIKDQGPSPLDYAKMQHSILPNLGAKHDITMTIYSCEDQGINNSTEYWKVMDQGGPEDHPLTFLVNQITPDMITENMKLKFNLTSKIYEPPSATRNLVNHNESAKGKSEAT